MSHISTGIFAALAVSLACGAIQLASGSDLTGAFGNSRGDASHLTTGAVNRAAKSDRLTIASNETVQGQTLSFRIHSLPDTSVLMRLPAPIRLDTASAASLVLKPSALKTMLSQPRKATVACEPVVSVLTEVAKLLEPGRCVT
jgi:hypothetical protein